MKKLLVFLVVLFPLFAQAQVPSGVFGFADGKYYDESQSLKYMCFGDGNCYDMNQKLAFSREVKGVATIEPVKTYTLLDIPNQWFPRAVDDSSVSEINIICKNHISDLIEVKCSNGTQYKVNVKGVLFNIHAKFKDDYQTINSTVVLSYRDDLIIPFIADSSNTSFTSETYAKFSVPVSITIPASDALGVKTETVIRAKGYGNVTTASLVLININGKDVVYKVN